MQSSQQVENDGEHFCIQPELTSSDREEQFENASACTREGGRKLNATSRPHNARQHNANYALR